MPQVVMRTVETRRPGICQSWVRGVVEYLSAKQGQPSAEAERWLGKPRSSVTHLVKSGELTASVAQFPHRAAKPRHQAVA
jgi:hypothetical protein